MKPAVIFDMGNVILPFDPLKPCRVLANRTGRSADEVCNLIYHHDLEKEFEEGKIDGPGFTEGVANVLGLDLDHDWFRNLWADMFTENHGVSAIVRKLRLKHPLVLLSNTNVWHFERAQTVFPVIREFEHTVLSYRVGELKPHPAMYRAALEYIDTGRPAVFIDDIEVNAVAAEQHGIKGIRFVSTEQLKKDLRLLGCEL